MRMTQKNALSEFSVHIKSDKEKLDAIVLAKNKTDAIFKGLRTMNLDAIGISARAEKMLPVAIVDIAVEGDCPAGCPSHH